MKDMEQLRKRFLRDPLPRRLGGLAAKLGRISSSARNSTDPNHVANLLDEAKHLIEWTAADTEPETAAELVRMQTLLTLWQKAWTEASQNPKLGEGLGVRSLTKFAAGVDKLRYLKAMKLV